MLSWKSVEDAFPPSGAIDFGVKQGAHSPKRRRLGAPSGGAFAVRVFIDGGLHLGFAGADGRPCVSYGGGVISDDRPFEVLCQDMEEGMEQGFVLKKAHGGAIPNIEDDSCPLQGGFEANGQPLYVALGEKSGVPGKAACHFGGCNTAQEGKEVREENYKVVCAIGGKTSSLALSKSLKANCFRCRLIPKNTKLPPVKNRFLSSVQDLLDLDLDLPPSTTQLSAKDQTSYRFFSESDSEPLVMHCHDMKGGYCKEADEMYDGIFDSWPRVDLFVYFSHHRVGIPPALWVENCQRNNIPCLGCIVTEHQVGIQENEMLIKHVDLVCEKLARLCATHGFNGYLVNLESEVSDHAKTVDFVGKLTKHVKGVLGENRGIVLYYDSLDSSGKISYQNGLSAENVAFFDRCDGILTNYWWGPDQLMTSAELGKDRQRLNRVFQGIDCFARGKVCHTAGIGEKGVNFAVEQVLNRRLSVGLFAPGWTVEAGPAHAALAELSNSETVISFQRQKDKEFWDALFNS